MAVNIHGKDYITVDERLLAAHKDCKALSISTEVLPIANRIVIKATVTTPKGTFTGISAANESKTIEKQSPFEVAETSAVGRALGFAGYGVVNGIATADEMVKAIGQGATDNATTPATPTQQSIVDPVHFCKMHNVALKPRGNGIWDHRAQGFLKDGELTRSDQGDWHHCQGKGYHLSAIQKGTRL